LRERESRRFLLDTNVFIAAFKSGYTKTARLLAELLASHEYELVVNTILLREYEKWLERLSEKIPQIRVRAQILYTLIKEKAVIVEPDREHIEACRPYIPETEYADLYHAATCLKAGAILVTNDKDFNRIKEAGIIEVWSISKAIKEILE